MNSYGVDQISTLEDIQAIRLRAGMYIGSVGLDGVHHIILEIISNIIDEYLNGHCSLGLIRINKDDSITITDNGRGVPCGKKEDGTETLEAVFTKLHTGAKFDSDGKGGYNTSGGMNGVGAKATNALSEWFTVIVKRDGKKHTMKFERGIRVSYEIESLTRQEDMDGVTGTSITFKPDKEIFKETIQPDETRLYNQLRELSFLSKGMQFIFINKKGEQKLLQAENGIIDYVDYLSAKNIPLTSKFYSSVQEDRIGVEIALMYNNSYGDNVRLYTNNIPNSSGTHLTGFRTALTRTINEYARDKKILKEKDDNLTGDDLKEGMVLVLSLKMPDPVFSGQTKDTLNSAEGRTIVERLVSKEIRAWFEANPNDTKTIIEKAFSARKARDAARKARENVRKKTKGISTVLPGKLADCSSKDPLACEIFIVEGKQYCPSYLTV